MKAYHHQVATLLCRFNRVKVKQVPRDKNAHADALACLTSALDSTKTRRITVEYLPNSSIEEASGVAIVQEGKESPSLVDPLLKFLLMGEPPENSKEARNIS